MLTHGAKLPAKPGCQARCVGPDGSMHAAKLICRAPILSFMELYVCVCMSVRLINVTDGFQ